MGEREDDLNLPAALANKYREPLHWPSYLAVTVIALGLFIWAMEVT